MTSLPAPPPIPVDWGDWRTALERFAAATGLCVSAYDETGRRQAGPFASSRVARLLGQADVWGEGCPGHTIERALVERVRASGEAVHELVLGELRVQAVPLAPGPAPGASVVYGWVFQSFGTALGCARLARHLGVDGARLWAEARLEAPVSEARMAVYSELLQTLIASSARHGQAIARLHELSRVREVFLAGVSHELRTPLSVLGTRIELLLRSQLDDPAAIRASLENMKRHVGEQARLVEDLIEAARTRTGQLPIDRRSASLAEILRSAIASVQPHAQTKGVHLAAPALEGDRLELFADAHRLQQVFWNLLSNAIKFTPAQGTVRVTLHSDAAWHEVEIADTGRGIDAALLPHVFDPFTTQRQGNEQGLGLGLAIARHIVELHGGRIAVDSAGADAGAVFRVQLPRRGAATLAAQEAAAPADALDQARRTIASSSPGSSGNSPSSAGDGAG